MVTKIILALGAALAAILFVGALQPETPRSTARNQCDNARAMAYTASEKHAADDICAELMRNADARSGRLKN